MAERKIPPFKNESEEGRWWFAHRDEIGNDLVSASRKGRLGEGSVARRARNAQDPKKVSLNAQRRFAAELNACEKNLASTG